MTAMPPKYAARDPLSTIPTDLPSEDGENMESAWHRDQMNLLIESLRVRWRGRTDYYCGGNMFIHFSPKHVRNQDFRGPDFFAVLDVDGTREREYWAVWDEEGRYPDVIVELLSPTTAKADRTTKKFIYERTFKTMNYFLYDPTTGILEGHRLDKNFRYQPLAPEEGRLWCEALGCWLGSWEGPFLEASNTWIRMFEPDGKMVPLFSELADAEKQRAEAAEAEIANLRAELERLKNSNP